LVHTLPGEYTVQTSDTVNGHKLVNNGKYAWIDPTSDDENISLDLQTISYTIKGQAGSTVFLSGKKTWHSEIRADFTTLKNIHSVRI